MRCAQTSLAASDRNASADRATGRENVLARRTPFVERARAVREVRQGRCRSARGLASPQVSDQLVRQFAKTPVLATEALVSPSRPLHRSRKGIMISPTVPSGRLVYE